MLNSHLVEGNSNFRQGKFLEAYQNYIQSRLQHSGSILQSHIDFNLSLCYRRITGRTPIYADQIEIFVYPRIEEKEELDDLIRRLTYFYSDLPGCHVSILTDLELPASLEKKACFESEIPNRYSTFRSQISVVKDSQEISPDQLSFAFNRSVIHDDESQEISNNLREKGVRIYTVDRNRQRHEGSFYIHAFFEFKDGFRCREEESYNRFLNVVGKHRKKNKKCYLFASGPSLGEYKKFDYDDGVKIICNTLSLNHEFVEVVEPDFIVFADPLFHYGCSSYSEDFLNSVERLLVKYPDLVIFTTTKFLYMLERRFYQWKDRIICAPMGQEGVCNVDLLTDFTVAATNNVFTLLMLPLAATLANDIRVIGFDGKPTSVKDTFWLYDKSSQNNGKYEYLKEVHPGFFKLDYDDFYLDHCRVVSDYITRMECFGKNVSSLVYSYIPALRRRVDFLEARELSADLLKERILSSDKENIYLSVNPDAADMNSGHFFAYDKCIENEVAPEAFFLSLVGKEFFADGSDNYIPWFTHYSWVMNRELDVYSDSFETEVSQLYDTLKRFSEKQFFLYMYMGHLKHLAILVDSVVSKLDNVHLTINLFGGDKYIQSEDIYSKYNRYFQSKGVSVCLESKKLIAQISNTYKQNFNIWPMIRSDIGCDFRFDFSPFRNLGDTPVVYFSATPQVQKGFDTILSMLVDRKDLGVRFLSRLRVTEHIKRDRALAKQFDRLNLKDSKDVDLVSNSVTAQEYKNLFLESDIIVIPYRLEFFEFKTSGAILDAIYYCRPTIAVKGTWAGDLIMEWGIGDVYEDGNPSDMGIAISKVIARYSAYMERLTVCRQEILESFSARRLVETISHTSRPYKLAYEKKRSI